MHADEDCLTFGLFAFVINALLFWIVGQLHLGFHVSGILAALFGSIVMSILTAILNWVIIRKPETDRDR